MRLKQLLTLPLVGLFLVAWTLGASAKPGSYCTHMDRDARSRPFSASFTMVDGSPLDFSNQDGRPALVDFFATWCGPCNEEMPGLLAIAHEYRKKGFLTLLVDESEPTDKVKAFVSAHDIDLPVAIDADGKIFERTGLQGFPSLLFFNAQGVLTCYALGSLEQYEFANEYETANSGWMP